MWIRKFSIKTFDEKKNVRKSFGPKIFDPKKYCEKIGFDNILIGEQTNLGRGRDGHGGEGRTFCIIFYLLVKLTYRILDPQGLPIPLKSSWWWSKINFMPKKISKKNLEREIKKSEGLTYGGGGRYPPPPRN